jgi:O-antigen ligase
MPQQWYDRMSTIQTYDQDQSAIGRINAWHMAYNMAKDRPLGGGFH